MRKTWQKQKQKTNIHVTRARYDCWGYLKMKEQGWWSKRDWL